jgi:flagella basal body P-ring formation protein FlgA
MKMYDNFFQTLNCRKLLTALGLLIASTPSLATEYFAAQLSSQANAWLETRLAEQGTENAKVIMYPVDQRIASKFCELPLEFSLVNQSIQTQNSIRVQCPDQSGWQVYLSAKVSKMVMALVSNRQLAAGSLITEDAIYAQEREQSQARGVLLQDPAMVIGARTKRSLNIGQIITNADLCLVCKGDIVTIEGISDSLVVSTAGKALNDGALGDNVRVQNLQSGRTIVASVSAIKKVAIKL